MSTIFVFLAALLLQLAAQAFGGVWGAAAGGLLIGVALRRAGAFRIGFTAATSWRSPPCSAATSSCRSGAFSLPRSRFRRFRLGALPAERRDCCATIARTPDQRSGVVVVGVQPPRSGYGHGSRGPATAVG
ncbi:MAG: hypothetical protein ACK5HM_11250, partial [Gemmatimonas sp.]|uniref:hypothetical protein n=1 Tax=Gemmatimonas sp. TaxID=1962908 RepID=UPI00391D0E5A